MRYKFLLGAACGALLTATLPVSAQSLVEDAAEAPAAAVGGALAVPGAVVGAATAPLATGPRAMGMGVVSTQDFRAEALRTDAYEIEASKLAIERTRDSRIRNLARDTIRDREATTAALLPPGTSLTASNDVVPESDGRSPGGPLAIATAPVTATAGAVGTVLGADDDETATAPPSRRGGRVALDPQRRAQLDQLAGLRGSQFDATFTRGQVASQRQAVALYSGYRQSGDDETARSFAGQALPGIQDNLNRTERLNARYDSRATR